MKRQELEKIATEAVSHIAKVNGGKEPPPGTPERALLDIGVALVVDTLSILDRVAVALEKIAQEKTA